MAAQNGPTSTECARPGCQETFTAPTSRGRPRLYCSDRCRVMIATARRRDNRQRQSVRSETHAATAHELAGAVLELDATLTDLTDRAASLHGSVEALSRVLYGETITSAMRTLVIRIRGAADEVTRAPGDTGNARRLTLLTDELGNLIDALTTDPETDRFDPGNT